MGRIEPAARSPRLWFEHVGARARDHGSRWRPALAHEVGLSAPRWWSSAPSDAAPQWTAARKCPAPPSERSSRSTDVTTDMAEAEACRPLRRWFGRLVRIERPRLAGWRIIAEGAGPACRCPPHDHEGRVFFCFQHSPMLGQAASSHTVVSPYSRNQGAWSRHIPASLGGTHPDPIRLAAEIGLFGPMRPSRGGGSARLSGELVDCAVPSQGLDMERPAISRQSTALVQHFGQSGMRGTTRGHQLGLGRFQGPWRRCSGGSVR